jgi:hypothetical protein
MKMPLNTKGNIMDAAATDSNKKIDVNGWSGTKPTAVGQNQQESPTLLISSETPPLIRNLSMKIEGTKSPDTYSDRSFPRARRLMSASSSKQDHGSGCSRTGSGGVTPQRIDPKERLLERQNSDPSPNSKRIF